MDGENNGKPIRWDDLGGNTTIFGNIQIQFLESGFFFGGKGTPIVVGKKTLGVPSPFLEVAPISRAKKNRRF